VSAFHKWTDPKTGVTYVRQPFRVETIWARELGPTFYVRLAHKQAR
jgi:hypothetical protein